MKVWGKILMGYEIFGQNYWFPSTPYRALLMTTPLNVSVVTVNEVPAKRE